jgi:hypothetical protein
MLPPGAYSLTVTLRDQVAATRAKSQRAITIRSAAFAIVAPRFSYDADGKAPAPVGGLLEQTLHFKMKVIGLDRSRDRIDLRLAVRILDLRTRRVINAPLQFDETTDIGWARREPATGERIRTHPKGLASHHAAAAPDRGRTSSGISAGRV